MIIRTDLIILATSKRDLISLITSLLKCTQKVSSELRLSRKTKQQRLHICRNDCAVFAFFYSAGPVVMWLMGTPSNCHLFV